MHAVKKRRKEKLSKPVGILEELVEEHGSKPLCETLCDLSITDTDESFTKEGRIHFLISDRGFFAT